MALVNCLKRKKRFIQEIGRTTKETEWGNIITRMEMFTKGCGKMI